MSLHCVKSETVSSVTARETAAERLSALCKDVYYTQKAVKRGMQTGLIEGETI